jgi:hypothetical protein
VAEVSRVLLDHVHQDVAERVFTLVVSPHGVQRFDGRDDLTGSCRGHPPDVESLVGLGFVDVEVGSFTVGPTSPVGGTGSPSNKFWNQARSTSARCRTNPSKERADGGTARCRSCAVVRSAHLITNVCRR